jgi:hypothetical protein
MRPMDKNPKGITDPVERLRAEADAQERAAAEAIKAAAEKREAAEKMQWLKDHGYPVPQLPTVEEAPAPISTVATSAFGKPTWTSVIMHILNSEGRGLTYDELQVMVEAHPLLPQLPTNFRNFYGAVERAKKRKELIKHEGRMFSATVFEDLKRRGALPTQKVKRATGSKPTRNFVMQVLKDAPEGLTREEIRARILTMPDAPRRVRAKAIVITWTVEDLAQRGVLETDGKVYRPKDGAKWSRTSKKAKGKTISGRPAPHATLFGSDTVPQRKH